MLEKELQIAQEAALKASEIILKHNHNAYVDFKANNAGPVTQADRDADLIIRQIIQKAFPNDILITEETFQKSDPVPESGRVWFIDPIDGTSYFIKGEDEYAVMIGLVIDTIPVLGVVLQPKTGLLWRAIDTRRVENTSSVVVAERIRPGQKPVQLNIKNKDVPSTGPIAIVSKRKASLFANFLNTELGISDIIKCGSVGLKLSAIADGKADFYITTSKHIKLWDTCAPFVILRAAGGSVQDIYGQNLYFGGQIEHDKGIFATTQASKKWLDLKLSQAIKKWKTHH